MKIDPENKDFSQNGVKILGVKITSTSKKRLLEDIQNKLTKKIHFYIVTPNPEIILQAQSDPNLRDVLNAADYSIPDGAGLKLAVPHLSIVKGRELMVDLFKIANEKKLKVYLLGARPCVLKKAVEKIKKIYPNIEIKGNSGPMLDNQANPVSEVDTTLQSEVVDEINKIKPDLLFVGFGAPKQEKWAYKNVKFSWMAVGGAFDYFVGAVKPVPSAFERFGIEWLWRLIQEPKRLLRIFNAVVVFPIKVILQGNQSKNLD